MGIRVRSNYTDIVVESDPVHKTLGGAGAAQRQSWRGCATVDGYRGEFALDADFPVAETMALRLKFLHKGTVYKAGSTITLTPEYYAGALDTNGDSMILGKLFDLIAAQLAVEHPKCMFKAGPCLN